MDAYPGFDWFVTTVFFLMGCDNVRTWRWLRTFSMLLPSGFLWHARLFNTVTILKCITKLSIFNYDHLSAIYQSSNEYAWIASRLCWNWPLCRIDRRTRITSNLCSISHVRLHDITGKITCDPWWICLEHFFCGNHRLLSIGQNNAFGLSWTGLILSPTFVYVFCTESIIKSISVWLCSVIYNRILFINIRREIFCLFSK